MQGGCEWGCEATGTATGHGQPQVTASHRPRPATGADDHGSRDAHSRGHAHDSTLGNSSENAAGMDTATATEPQQRVWPRPQPPTAMGMTTSHTFEQVASKGRAYGYHHPVRWSARSACLTPAGHVECTCRKEPESRWDVKHDASAHVRGII